MSIDKREANVGNWVVGKVFRAEWEVFGGPAAKEDSVIPRFVG